MIKRSEDWNLVYQALSANSASKSRRKCRRSRDIIRDITLAFGEPFALHKVCTTSFIKYCKAKFIVRQQSRLIQPNQRVKKVVSDSLGLVDFAIGLMNSVLNLPDGQVKIFRRLSKITEVL